MEPRKELAAIIRKARLDSGLKQEVFAREVGIVAAHLSRLEHGQGLPSIQLVQKIANRFGADLRRMMKLLRTIKGFEEIEESTPPRGTGRKPSAGFPAPLISVAECRAWVEELLLGREPTGGIGTEFVARHMTRDRHAFWVQAEGREMCGGAIQEADLVLVEPTLPLVNGRPALIVAGAVSICVYRESAEATVPEKLAGPHPRLAVISKEDLPKKGVALRLAGVRPRFRSF